MYLNKFDSPQPGKQDEARNAEQVGAPPSRDIGILRGINPKVARDIGILRGINPKVAAEIERALSIVKQATADKNAATELVEIAENALIGALMLKDRALAGIKLSHETQEQIEGVHIAKSAGRDSDTTVKLTSAGEVDGVISVHSDGCCSVQLHHEVVVIFTLYLKRRGGEVHRARPQTIAFHMKLGCCTDSLAHFRTNWNSFMFRYTRMTSRRTRWRRRCK